MICLFPFFASLSVIMQFWQTCCLQNMMNYIMSYKYVYIYVYIYICICINLYNSIHIYICTGLRSTYHHDLAASASNCCTLDPEVPSVENFQREKLILS